MKTNLTILLILLTSCSVPQSNTQNNTDSLLLAKTKEIKEHIDKRSDSLAKVLAPRIKDSVVYTYSTIPMDSIVYKYVTITKDSIIYVYIPVPKDSIVYKYITVPKDSTVYNYTTIFNDSVIYRDSTRYISKDTITEKSGIAFVNIGGKNILVYGDYRDAKFDIKFDSTFRVMIAGDTIISMYDDDTLKINVRLP